MTKWVDMFLIVGDRVRTNKDFPFRRNEKLTNRAGTVKRIGGAWNKPIAHVLWDGRVSTESIAVSFLKVEVKE